MRPVQPKDGELCYTGVRAKETFREDSTRKTDGEFIASGACAA